jgi:hypothetical protein
MNHDQPAFVRKEIPRTPLAPLAERLRLTMLYLQHGPEVIGIRERLAFGSDPWYHDPDPLATVHSRMAEALSELAAGLLKEGIDLVLTQQLLVGQQADGQG